MRSRVEWLDLELSVLSVKPHKALVNGSEIQATIEGYYASLSSVRQQKQIDTGNDECLSLEVSTREIGADPARLDVPELTPRGEVFCEEGLDYSGQEKEA